MDERLEITEVTERIRVKPIRNMCCYCYVKLYVMRKQATDGALF